jgi:ADP-dependent NAD(P)H-hydrate dehydratase / NAD(P)H-hydrate epimerase
VTSTRTPFGEPLLTSAELRQVEATHAKLDLMRRAGKAAADFLRARTTRDTRIVLFAGPGNNGGDALACAAELAVAGYAPVVVLLGDPAKFGEDAARAWRRVSELRDLSRSGGLTPSPLKGDTTSLSPVGSGGEGEAGVGLKVSSANHPTPHRSPLPQGERGRIVVLREIPQTTSADWIIDGLFGIGLKRPLDGVYSDAVAAVAAVRAGGAEVLALDVPSGVDADTGATVGDAVVIADFTLTFIAKKPGLVTGPALDYVGELHCASLDLPPLVPSAEMVRLLNASFLDAVSKIPVANAHKGTHGTCVIVGGANGMLGAALLAGRAAMRTGAGKVKVAWLAEPRPQVDPLMPEVMMGSASELINSDWHALVIGCGLGVSGTAVRILKSALKRDAPMVIDADALNLIAESADLATLVQRRTSPTIITPHPAEAARMLGCSTADVQRNRVRAAGNLATGYRCIAVVKGAGTVVCEGALMTINGTGNPLLATAGTGDVLAGMIGALLAQGFDAATAARLGVCMHGAAADAMRARGVKRAVAGDFIDELRRL